MEIPKLQKEEQEQREKERLKEQEQKQVEEEEEEEEGISDQPIGYIAPPNNSTFNYFNNTPTNTNVQNNTNQTQNNNGMSLFSYSLYDFPH